MDTIKKWMPVAVGVIVAIVGVLLALGLAQLDVEQALPVEAGQAVEFTAGSNAIMVKAAMKVDVEGKTYESPACWILFNMEPPVVSNEVPEKPIVPVAE